MNDKKKIMIVASLGVVMLGVGAFQFMAGSAPPPKTAEKEKEHAATAVYDTGDTSVAPQGEQKSASADPNGEKPALLGDGAKPAGAGDPAAADKSAGDVNSLTMVAARDPFDGRAWIKFGPNSGVQGAVIPPPKNYGGAPKGFGTSGLPNIPPVIPNAGGIVKEGSFAPGGLPPVGPGNTGSAPQGAMPSVDDVEYEVSGTIRGKKAAAVFKDSGGGQRLIRVGDKLDENTEVLSVSDGKVTVKHRGKVKVLKVNRDLSSSESKNGKGTESPNRG